MLIMAGKEIPLLPNCKRGTTSDAIGQCPQVHDDNADRIPPCSGIIAQTTRLALATLQQKQPRSASLPWPCRYWLTAQYSTASREHGPEGITSCARSSANGGGGSGWSMKTEAVTERFFSAIGGQVPSGVTLLPKVQSGRFQHVVQRDIRVSVAGINHRAWENMCYPDMPISPHATAMELPAVEIHTSRPGFRQIHGWKAREGRKEQLDAGKVCVRT